MNISEFELLSSVFEKESEWLSKIIRQRLQLFLGNRDGVSIIENNNEFIPPEYADSDLAYINFINKNNLSFEERVLLALLTISNLKPYFLSEAFTRFNSAGEITRDLATEFYEIGLIKSQNSSILIPTQLTFLFLLAGRDLKERLRIASLFNSQSILVEKKVVHFERTSPGEPMYSGKLILAQIYFDLFTLSMVDIKTISYES